MMPTPQVTDRLKEAPAIVLRAVFAGIGQVLMAADKLRVQLQEQLGAPAPQQPPAGQAERQQPAAAGNVTRLSDRQGPGGQGPHTRPASPAPPATGPAPGSAEIPRAAAPAATTAAKPAARSARPAAKAAPAKAAATKPAPAKAAATKSAAAKPAATKPATKAARAKATAKPAPAKATDPRPARAKSAAAKPAARPAPVKSAAKPATGPAPVPPVAGYDSLSVASLRARLRGLDPDGVRALLDYERATASRDDVIIMYERRLARLAGETG
jgi:hypothetical protein